MTEENKPRCPVCGSPLDIWSDTMGFVSARCGQCGWDWSE